MDMMKCLGGMRLQFFLTLFTRATPGTPASNSNNNDDDDDDDDNNNKNNNTICSKVHKKEIETLSNVTTYI